ncbi:MAG: ABC transporter substrate-binding protein, partial [Planktomarina sp.]
MNRRFALLSATAMMVAGPTFALNKAQATRLVDALVGEINAVINSGSSESRMVGNFEKILVRYA